MNCDLDDEKGNNKYRDPGGSNELGDIKEQKEGHVPGKQRGIMKGDKVGAVS